MAGCSHGPISRPAPPPTCWACVYDEWDGVQNAHWCTGYLQQLRHACCRCMPKSNVQPTQGTAYYQRVLGLQQLHRAPNRPIAPVSTLGVSLSSRFSAG
eukprot:5415784-Amphidinium_carterae.1